LVEVECECFEELFDSSKFIRTPPSLNDLIEEGELIFDPDTNDI